MSWVCDNCSTINEEHDTTCFVCDEPRSIESIREAKRVVREAKIEKAMEAMYKSTTICGKAMFIISVSVFFIVAIILVAQRIINGDFNEFYVSLSSIFKNIKISLTNFGGNFPEIWNAAVIPKASGIPDNTVAIFEKIGVNFEYIFTEVMNNLVSIIRTKGEILIGIIAEIFDIFQRKFTNLKIIFEKLFFKAKGNFLQFGK